MRCPPLCYGSHSGSSKRLSSMVIVAVLVSALLSPATHAQNTAPANAAPAARTKTEPVTQADAHKATAANAGPDMTSETYGDWILRCRQPDGEKVCELTQTLVVQGQTNPVALIAVGREKKADPLKLLIQLPTNITFEGGVRAQFSDNTTGLDLTYKRCLPSGCFAELMLTNDLIGKLKAQSDAGSIKFKDGLGRDAALPMSFKGFPSVIDALSRL